MLIGRAGPGVNNVIQGLYDHLQDGKSLERLERNSDVLNQSCPDHLHYIIVINYILTCIHICTNAYVCKHGFTGSFGLKV